MKKSKSIDFFEQKSPQEITNFIDHSVEIADQIHDYLDEKDWSQKELAKKMRETDAEVSKW